MNEGEFGFWLKKKFEKDLKTEIKILGSKSFKEMSKEALGKEDSLKKWQSVCTTNMENSQTIGLV